MDETPSPVRGRGATREEASASETVEDWQVSDRGIGIAAPSVVGDVSDKTADLPALSDFLEAPSKLRP